MQLQKLGTVVVFHKERNFGFLEVQSGRRYYFHISQWVSDLPPTVGDKALFHVGPPFIPGKPEQAMDVRLTDEVQAGAEALNVSQHEVHS